MMNNIFSNNYLRRMAFFGLVLLIIVAGSWFPANETKAAAGVSKILSYQGRLTDTSGNPVADGTWCMRFSIWNVSTGGTRNPNQLWPSAYAVPASNNVTVTNGVFSVGIGAAETLNFDFSSNDTVYLYIEVNPTITTCGGTWEALSPYQRIDATAYARVAENLYGGEVRVGTSTAVAVPNQKLLKLGLANSAETVGGLCSTAGYPDGAMWYNSNVANARTLVCNNGIIQVVGGAMTNQFFEVAGPASTIKTFTFPDANTKVLGVPIATTIAVGDLFYAGTANSGSLTNLADVAAGSYLRSGGVTTAPAWSTVTLPNTVTTGDLLYASATNVLSVLPKGTANKVLSMDGTGTNVTWATPTGGGLTVGTTTIASGAVGKLLFENTGNVLGEATNVNIASGNLNLTAITTPGAASAGTVTLFGRNKANRILPAIIGPSGLDTSLQPLLGSNKVAWWNPPGNATTVPGVIGFTAPTVVGTATTRNVATTNVATMLKRLGYVTATTTAGSMVEQRVAVAQYAMGGGAAGVGGFFLVVRFVPSDAAAVSGERFFIGMTSATGAATNTEPSGLTNVIGLAQLSTSTNLQIVYGGSAAQTAIDLGAGFPGNTLSTEAYEFVLFNSPTSNNSVGYLVTRLSTGASASGTLSAATPGTQLPASTTLLTYKAWKTNNATALAVAFDIASIYIETDN